MDMAANRIANRILFSVKKWYDDGKLREPNIYMASTTFKYDGFPVPVKSTIKIEVVDEYMVPPFYVNASYQSRLDLSSPLRYVDNQINFDIVVSIYFGPKQYNDFYMRTVGVVRHELEHYSDDMAGKLHDGKQDYDPQSLIQENQSLERRFENTAQYLFSKVEQVPFIRGVMIQCKKEGKSLEGTLREFIQSQLFSPNPKMEEKIRSAVGDLKAKHVEDMMTNLYLQRAEEIFPNMK